MKNFIFGANFDPLSNRKTSEQIVVKMPATTEKEAWDKLEWMVGGLGRIGFFYMIDVEPYD